jgi:hypothetical protein
MSLLKRRKGSAKEHFVMAHFEVYQDGTLAEKETAVYEGHLATCQECQAWTRRQENLVAGLGMEMASPVFLAPAAAARIQQNLYSSMRRAVIMNNIRTSAVTVGALAVLALVVGVFVLWQVGSFGPGLQAPNLGQGAAGQGELVLDQATLDEGLVKALADSDLAGMESLLDEGADAVIDHQEVETYTVQDTSWTTGWTALHMAVYGGYGTPENNLEVVRILIEHGAALDIEDDDGQTPLDIAVPGSEI